MQNRIPVTVGVLLAGSLSLLAGCGILDPGPESGEPISRLPRPLTAAEETVVSASNRFAFDLLRQVNEDEAGENVFVSPLSVSMALGMTMNGAANETLDEMRSTLDFGDLTQDEINGSYRDLIDLLLRLDRSTRIEIANSVWYRRDLPVEQTFLDTVRDVFGAGAEAVDFADPATLGRINGWVSNATHNRIPKILDVIRPEEVMFLVNAIWFEGAWRTRFPAENTWEADFAAPGGPHPVSLMNVTGDFHQRSTPEYIAIELPYGNTAFAMTIVMPREREIDGFVRSLDRDAWDAILSSLWVGQAAISIPKFTLEYEKTLDDALKALGMPAAFMGGEADFSGLSAEYGRDLYITEVKHKTFVKVDEKGTEAAGATSVGIGLVSMPAPLIIDRPFVFAIRERFSGTILFAGKVTKPEI